MLRVLKRGILVKKVTWKQGKRELKLCTNFRNVPTLRSSEAARLLSSGVCPPKYEPPKSHTGRNALLGALALFGATLGYAKYDDEFRRMIEDNVPYSDQALKYLLFEENPFGFISEYYDSLREMIVGASNSSSSQSSDIQLPKSYKGGDVKVEDDRPDIQLLERQISEAATEAVNAYNRAIYNLKKYSAEICHVIDEQVDRIKPDVWDRIREKGRLKKEAIQCAEEKAAEASKKIVELKCIISEDTRGIPATKRDIILANIQQVQQDIEKGKNELEREKKGSTVTEKYWDKVESARKHFSYELETLFPSVKLDAKELNLSAEEFDLFILHAYANVLYYQKELARMDTVIHDKIQRATENASRRGEAALTEAQICEAIQQEKRKLALCFQQQSLKMKKEADCEMREALKRQSQTFADHLAEAIEARAKEIERELTRAFDEQLESERCKFKYQLATMVGRLKGLDHAIKQKANQDASEKRAQVLWSACQALIRSLKAGCPGQNWRDQLRPLNPEISAVQKAAAENDELVNTVVAAIPKEALERGVYPEEALKERFLKVEQVARKVALVPEGGASLPVHILSYIQSLLLVKAASPIPQAELEDKSEIDFTKLDTNDVLQRARYWMDRGDIEQTLKYMNLLKGAPRSVARQWMNEARILLETQQAANTLMAYAASSGLVHL
ncbi:MICOS complex subunit Mic60 isoform X2 [Aethina tumida]|uniref:MICOS complex subunit Mic60 isoform X2 n=1 Tax=Aethina tumida TaxID=116153 RepID=UPI0021491842|nr:MICOS complex subunit Mic60 isoform X2 [Aethina tumida]